MVHQMVINVAASAIGLSLATLSYATRVVAGEAYQAKLDALFGVRYEVRARHPCDQLHAIQYLVNMSRQACDDLAVLRPATDVLR